MGSAIALIAETEAEITEAKKQAESHAGGGSQPEQAASVAVQGERPDRRQTTGNADALRAPVEVSTATVATSNGNSNASGRTVASPRAKKLAKQMGVDLKSLQGSGPYGRITAGDVEQASGKPVSQPVAKQFGIPDATTNYAAPAKNAAPVVPAGVPVVTPAPASSPAPVTPGQTVPLNTLQKAVVQNMMTSLGVPTFHVTYTINTDALDGLYKQIKPKGVTMTALLAKAIAVTLKNHPVVNANYAQDAISYNSDINVAVAVAMPDGGLITPVLRNADQMDIYSLSRTWKDLVARSRSKQLQPEEYSTGTFTLSNLGMFGVDNFDAILPQGQGSIIAIGGSKPQLVADDSGMMGVKRQMKVNITSDHRIIYGAQAAAFLKDLATLIETNVQSLTM